MKIIFKFSACLIILFTLFLALPTKAQTTESPLNIYFFTSDGCPHCAKAKEFIYGPLVKEYPSLVVNEYEISKNTNNAKLLKKVANNLNIRVAGVPFILIGDRNFVGYSDGISDKLIQQRVGECFENFCPDTTASIALASADASEKKDEEKNPKDINSFSINLPLLGNINVFDFSLPIITIIIGSLDGFNPCAMWVLVFLISLLFDMKDRKKMWLLGGTFIVASASVYFLFMAAWLNLILFLGFIIWVRLIIGIVALLGGGYSLKDFFVNKNAECKVVDANKKKKTFDRLKNIIHQNNLWLALGGIIILAFAINLVELICSAGLPTIYAQILALNNLSVWQHYLYILLYIFFFMLDDLIIFIIAMKTLKITGVTTKYTRLSRLIGGLIMLAIGLLLIFKPEWLMFG